MNIALLVINFLWLVVLITGLVIWIPKYVDSQYQDVTVHFVILGFTFLGLTTKMVKHILNGEVNIGYVVLYTISIALLLLAITGVYYWLPKYFPQGITDPITGKTDMTFASNILVACFTISLIFMNMYEQEYAEAIYKSGDITSTLINFGGKRKLKK
jgi:cytochrome b subunit of formate dehydrogenase